MLLVVVNDGVFVELKCILHDANENKLLREKEDYVILDLAHYRPYKSGGWLNELGHQIIGNGKKENKLYDK